VSARCGQPRINSTVSPPTSAVVLKDAGAANRMTSWHRHNGGGEMVRKRRSCVVTVTALVSMAALVTACARPGPEGAKPDPGCRSTGAQSTA
jgi:hypothetical protein